MSDDAVPVPVHAVRVGPGQFLLAAGSVQAGLTFVVDVQTYVVVSGPVPVGTGTYLATVEVTAGPGVGRQLSAQLQVGRKVQG